MDSVSNQSNEPDTASGDVEVMKKELTEYGFNEENMCKEEMSDLLKALRFSKSSAIEEDNKRATSDIIFKSMTSSTVETNRSLTRRFRNVSDRRLPWCLLPANLTAAQKVKCLSTYLKLLSINQYMRARGLSKFETWPAPIRITSRSMSSRATRSGRSAPSYTFVDDDSNELDDFVPKKPKKRKTSTSESTDGIYTNKTFSLKRKTTNKQMECPEKESKVNESSEACWLNADSTKMDDDQDDTSTTNICKLIDSIYKINEDVSTSKEPQKALKTCQRKT